MARWIAFDDESADAVMTRYRRGAAEIQHGDPVDAALALGKPSLLLLPSETPGRVWLARCTPKLPLRSAGFQPSTPAPLVAPAFTRRPAQPQPQPAPRKWWQRRSA
jgi:hypothetical protein